MKQTGNMFTRLTLFLTIAVLPSCMGRFNLETSATYKETPELVTALVREGYEIESYTTTGARTKVSTMLRTKGHKSLEFQVWYVVKDNTLSVFCTERVLPVWRFKSCEDTAILDLINYELALIKGESDV